MEQKRLPTKEDIIKTLCSTGILSTEDAIRITDQFPDTPEAIRSTIDVTLEALTTARSEIVIFTDKEEFIRRVIELIGSHLSYYSAHN